jgi:hypothetical protein
MAGRAIDVESFPPALQHRASDGKGKRLDQVRPDLAGVEGPVRIQMSARDSVRHERTRSHVVVLKEVALLKRLFERLMEHVAPATRRHHPHQRERDGQAEKPAGNFGLPPRRLAHADRTTSEGGPQTRVE